MTEVLIPEPERFRTQAYLSVLADGVSELSCRFQAEALQEMQHIAEKGYPDEICGLLVGKATKDGWEVESVRQVENLNKERSADRFELDPAGFQQVDKELRGTGQEIIGVFHSHPDCPARPSPTDLSSAWEGFIYPIVAVVEGKVAEVNCWTLTDDVSLGGRFHKLNHQV